MNFSLLMDMTCDNTLLQSVSVWVFVNKLYNRRVRVSVVVY